MAWIEIMKSKCHEKSIHSLTYSHCFMSPLITRVLVVMDYSGSMSIARMEQNPPKTTNIFDWCLFYYSCKVLLKWWYFKYFKYPNFALEYPIKRFICCDTGLFCRDSSEMLTELQYQRNKYVKQKWPFLVNLWFVVCLRRTKEIKSNYLFCTILNCIVYYFATYCIALNHIVLNQILLNHTALQSGWIVSYHFSSCFICIFNVSDRWQCIDRCVTSP